MTKQQRSPRGYALIFVIVVSVALGIVVGGLFAFLAETVSSSRQTQEELQQLYGCDGALRLAFHEAGKNRGDVDISKLQAGFGALSSALQADINPRTGRPYADLDGIEVKSSDTQALQATGAPFHGLQFVQEGFEFIVTANPDLSRGRTCRAQSPNRLRTISYFQFAMVSNDILIGRPSNVGSVLDVTDGTTGDVYTLQHSAGEPGRLRQRRSVTPRSTARGAFSVQDIHISDKETFRPVPPSGQPWSFINKKKKFFGGTKRRTKHKRPQLEYFVKYPTNTPSIDPTLSRFAMQADIRIIDGEWFLPNAFGSYPGTKRWSDRPSGRSATRPLMYSAYETIDGRARGGAAVITYGVVGTDGKPRVAGVCADDEVLATVVDKPGDTFVFDCDGTEVIPDAGTDPLVKAASQGFFDPYQTGGSPTAILPIILDIGALAAAMNTEGTGDLGDDRCLSPNDVLCPETRRFDGAIWVGTLPAGMNPATGSPVVVAGAPLGVSELPPCPLAGGSSACARPNALVITNAADLEAFQRTGLSIGTNLPMYVIGNVNSETRAAVRTSRVALMAPSITGLSSDFDLTSLAWAKGDDVTAASSSETLSWHASLFTAWASSSELKRDPSKHLLRRLQDGLRIDVTGSAVAMFRRQDYDKIQVFNSSKGSFSSPQPDPLIVGLPMFIPDGSDNADEEGSRLAPGTLRYPGEEVRDLRRARKEHQPPAAPRFSIDPAPIDRR